MKDGEIPNQKFGKFGIAKTRKPQLSQCFFAVEFPWVPSKRKNKAKKRRLVVHKWRVFKN